MFSGPMFTVCLTMALSAVIVPTHGHAAVLAARVAGSMGLRRPVGPCVVNTHKFRPNADPPGRCGTSAKKAPAWSCASRSYFAVLRPDMQHVFEPRPDRVEENQV